MNTPEGTPSAPSIAVTNGGEVTVTVTETKPVKKSKKVAEKAKTKAKSAKKKADKLSQLEFARQLVDLLYGIRKSNPVLWANMRNSSKEGDKIHSLLLKQPDYRWRQHLSAHYLETHHDGEGTVVAYILIRDPMAEYKKEAKEHELILANNRIKKKPKAPLKPTSRKKDYRWHIAGKRGIDEASGVAASIELAKIEVMKRTSQFVA